MPDNGYSAEKRIDLIGVKTNNLRDVSLAIPKRKLVGIAGVSGSGKSSLVSTLAAGAQQTIAPLLPPFIQARMKTVKPGTVDGFTGLTFTAVVDQRKFGKNVRSSVSTMSGIAPYLRLLFSRAASPSAGFSPSYSPNDPRGMCEACSGLGYVDDIDLDELIDPNLSLNEGAIRFPSFEPGTYRWKRLVLSGIADVNEPWKNLPEDARQLLLYGKEFQLKYPLPGYPKHGKFDGVIPRLRASYLEKSGAKITQKEDAALRRTVKRIACPECDGQRINEAARISKLNGLNIAQASRLSIGEFMTWLQGINDTITIDVRQVILERCKHLHDIGLGYLSLDRPTDSLSGGEAQRLRIVGLLSAPITDATFVMDEPSSGLHPVDVDRLLTCLIRLRDTGNTIIIVEHNLQILSACDYVIELGPGAGADGGKVLFAGHPQALVDTDTPTGRALRAGLQLNGRPHQSYGKIHVSHARAHNLKDVSVDFPLGVLTVVSGVAGSGKSSLASVIVEQHPSVTMIDQLPLSATSRSSLLTALDLDQPIRKVFSALSGLDQSWFSSAGKGACPSCKGRGVIRVDMAFMDDVETVCEQCEGRKFNKTALSAKVMSGSRRYSIADVLEADLDEVAMLFKGEIEVCTAVSLLRDVGLGYLKLGRTLNTLSGGELQRLKLVQFLKQHRQDDNGVIVLDEVTTGSHPKDVEKLIQFLQQLTSQGLTIIAIDHNPALIAQADYNIDIGPGAGTKGGSLIFAGIPAELAQCKQSQTGMRIRQSIMNP